MASPARTTGATPLPITLHATFSRRVEDRTLKAYWKPIGSAAVCVGSAADSVVPQSLNTSSGHFYVTRRASPQTQYIPSVDFTRVIAALAQGNTGKSCAVTCKFDLPTDDLIP